MDPKEYLPFLESMSALSESKRRVAIDTHLKRFDTAVACLSACGDYDEAVVRHCLALAKPDSVNILLCAGFGEENWLHLSTCRRLCGYRRVVEVSC
jgi:hypothetical protein